jgi:xanthine dehydrogenase YagR molybdenum-binding subunit
MPKLIKSTVEIEGRIAERYALVEGDELPAWGADAELGIVGYPAARVDGAARAGGMARYTADVQLPGMAYTAFVPCPHPHARLLSIDVAAARKLPGVLGVLTRREVAAQLRPGSTSGLGGALALRYGDELCYAGEIVAAVAASDPDIAADAVALIAAEYATLPHVVDLEAAARPDAPSARPGGNLFGSQPHVVERGDVAAGLASAEVVVEQTYRTAGQVHSCLEPHGTVAHWEGDMLTIYETTQHVFGSRNLLADWLGLPRSQVRVICQYLGGGFGSKAEPGPTTVYAALLARQIRRPVRAVYPRAIEQIAGGHRSATITHVKLGARRDGSLTAIELRCLTDLGAYGAWLPDVPAPALLMYRCANARAENLGVFTNTGTFEAFRAPGFVEGTFAIESAIDELAAALGMDPIELRRTNIPDRDQVGGSAFSNYPVETCYAQGAERIGWSVWQPTANDSPRFRRGLGMAGQIWGGGGGPPAYATVELNSDGTATLRTGTQDLGTGTKTALAQVCAEELGLPLAAIRTVLGDSGAGPYAPISGGSMTVPSMAPAVRAAARNARLQLIDIAAQLFEVAPDALEVRGGAIYSGEAPLSSVRELAQKLGDAMISGSGSRGPNPEGVRIVTSGAQFVEVEVDTFTGRVRVVRVVAAHDCGRIVNPLTFRSQIEGGIIQGLGYALTERRMIDSTAGLALNANLADYKLPTSADVPPIEVLRIDIPDLAANPTGAKGAGEPPIIPTAAAIANAVADAIGVRIRELPITPEKVLDALCGASSAQ